MNDNTAPVAVDDDFAVDPNSATTTFAVIVGGSDHGTDTDGEGDTLSINSFTQPTNGTTVINGTTAIDYTPDADFYGIDTFTYDISDGSATSATSATVTVYVRQTSHPEDTHAVGFTDPTITLNNGWEAPVDQFTALTVGNTYNIWIESSNVNNTGGASNFFNMYRTGSGSTSVTGSFTENSPGIVTGYSDRFEASFTAPANGVYDIEMRIIESAGTDVWIDRMRIISGTGNGEYVKVMRGSYTGTETLEFGVGEDIYIEAYGTNYNWGSVDNGTDGNWRNYDGTYSGGNLTDDQRSVSTGNYYRVRFQNYGTAVGVGEWKPIQIVMQNGGTTRETFYVTIMQK